MSIATQFSLSHQHPSQKKDFKQDSPIISKITSLLSHQEEKNVLLAFQLMVGLQEASPNLNSLCLGLVCFHPSNEVRQAGLVYLDRQNTTAALKDWLHGQQPYAIENEEKASIFIANATHHPYLEAAYLALILLRHKQLGVKYSLEQSVLPAEKVLAILSKGDWLSLENKQLNFLPAEIGLFTQLRSLNISGNCFTKLPEEIAKLSNLDSLYFHRTPLSRYSLKQLERTFPHIFAEKLYMQSIGFFEERNYQEALLGIDKALKLNPEVANHWNAKGLIFQQTDFIKESIQYFEKAIQLNPYDAQLYTNLALSLLKDKKYTLALANSQKGIEIASQNPQNGAKNLDILYIYQGQALSGLQQFEAAEQSFYKSLQLNAETGLAWYHLAKLFALRQQSMALVDCLRKAIQLNRRFLREAQNEAIFKSFYHEKSLKALLKAK